MTKPTGSTEPTGSTDAERDVGAFLRQFAALDRSVAADPCPDDLLLAGFAEGRLLPEERANVETHLGRCARCRATVVALGDVAGSAGPVEELHRPRATVRSFLVAAAAVLLVGSLGVLLFGNDHARRVDDARLAAAALELARSAPGLFADFRPLDADERLAPPRDPVRGGALVLLRPFGVIGDVRPTFAWSAVPGASAYDVEVGRLEGATVLRTRAATTALGFPAAADPLERGATYLVQVSCDAATGTATARRTFAVASAGAEQHTARALERIDALDDDAVRPILAAHFLVRAERFGAAEGVVREHLNQHPSDRVGLETLYHVLTRIGAPEATNLRRRIDALPEDSG